MGASILRLQVTDKDVAHTPAWRANYTVHGAAASHFTVETDGETNDGILTVVKVGASRFIGTDAPVSFTSGVIHDVHAHLSAPVRPDCSALNTHSVNHRAALSVRGHDDRSVGQHT